MTEQAAIQGLNQDRESPELDEGFDEEANSTNSDGSLVIPDDNPKSAKEKEDKSNDKADEKDNKPDDNDKADGKKKAADGDDDKGKEVQEDSEPKTAAERAEIEAKKLEEGEKGSEQQAEDVVDILPEEYAKLAKQAMVDGKLEKFIATQPKRIQEMATSGDPDDAICVLDLYKSSQGKSEGAIQADKEVKSLLGRYGDMTFKAPDGTDKTLKDMAAEYGNEELLESLGPLLNQMITEATKGLKSSDGKGSEELEQMRAEVQAMKAEQAFWSPVLDAHSDARKIAKSGKLAEWAKNQSEGIQRLYQSGNPDHAILIIDAYKESLANGMSAAEKEKMADKKKKIDGLHGESLSDKRTVKSSTKTHEDGEKEEEDAFNEEANKK